MYAGVLLALLCAGAASAKVIDVAWTKPYVGKAVITAACGDALNFKADGFHDLVQIKSASCTAPTIKQVFTSPMPATNKFVNLTSIAKTFYKCSVGDHCSKGHMLITVDTKGPCPVSAPLPAKIPISWTTGKAYTPIAARCGDTLVFTAPGGTHDVVQIASHDCSAPIKMSWGSAPMSTINVKLTAAGKTSYKCSVGSHCQMGMLIDVNTVC